MDLKELWHEHPYLVAGGGVAVFVVFYLIFSSGSSSATTSSSDDSSALSSYYNAEAQSTAAGNQLASTLAAAQATTAQTDSANTAAMQIAALQSASSLGQTQAQVAGQVQLGAQAVQLGQSQIAGQVQLGTVQSNNDLAAVTAQSNAQVAMGQQMANLQGTLASIASQELMSALSMTGGTVPISVGSGGAATISPYLISPGQAVVAGTSVVGQPTGPVNQGQSFGLASGPGGLYNAQGQLVIPQ